MGAEVDGALVVVGADVGTDVGADVGADVGEGAGAEGIEGHEALVAADLQVSSHWIRQHCGLVKQTHRLVVAGEQEGPFPDSEHECVTEDVDVMIVCAPVNCEVSAGVIDDLGIPWKMIDQLFNVEDDPKYPDDDAEMTSVHLPRDDSAQF